MRGRDPETGEYLDESRSQKRREALDVLAMAGKLMEASRATLGQLPLPDDLRALVIDSQRITSHIARKRQTQYLAKQMRRESEEVLDALRAALEHTKEDARREAAALHRIEHWRQRLIDEGDAALAEFLAAHPAADRQQLRALVRNARAERLANRPPHSFRELFRVLRALMAEAEEAAEDEAGVPYEDGDAPRGD
ncbi:ribosome biogenesis factor YjgA [Silanimonas lenta]|uniref:ribosome biogenesis factor YjgA n=1 Tax=Silanimonas lenta TaxID=265429 RepID=UPI0003FA49B6|nr:ribosome biogenesis factor YjgA [Silanimonas lenta]